MKVLVFTHMYPSLEHPYWGVFVSEQVRSLRALGIEVDVLHADVLKTRFLYLFSLFLLWKRLLTSRYDLVHAHYVFAGVIARLQLSVPVVLTHHGDETFFGWQSVLSKIVSSLVDQTIVVSPEMKKAIGLPAAEIIPCGVDFERFKWIPKENARQELGLPEDKKLILFAGDKSKSLKRFDLVESAVDLLLKNGMPVELVVAYREPYDRIPLFMNACDVLVLPSEREGSPQVIKEAMACNLPVVASDVGDVVEMIRETEGCYICERRAEDIAQKINLALKFGKNTNGREHIEKYELLTTARQIKCLYEAVLAR